MIYHDERITSRRRRSRDHGLKLENLAVGLREGYRHRFADETGRLRQFSRNGGLAQRRCNAEQDTGQPSTVSEQYCHREPGRVSPVLPRDFATVVGAPAGDNFPAVEGRFQHAQVTPSLAPVTAVAGHNRDRRAVLVGRPVKATARPSRRMDRRQAEMQVRFRRAIGIADKADLLSG
jgi:hypothetical protein